MAIHENLNSRDIQYPYSIVIIIHYNVKNNSQPLADFRPISAFSQSKSILVGHISCTFSMGQQSVTCKISYFQKNSRPISDPDF